MVSDKRWCSTQLISARVFESGAEGAERLLSAGRERARVCVLNVRVYMCAFHFQYGLLASLCSFGSCDISVSSARQPTPAQFIVLKTDFVSKLCRSLRMFSETENHPICTTV